MSISKKKLFKSLFGICALLTVSVTTTAQTFQAGVIDDFALPSEAAHPSVELASFQRAVQDFDLIANVNGGLANSLVAHTFTGLPTDIINATLKLRVRAGDISGTVTDGIILSFVDNTTVSYLDAIVWSRTFGFFNGPFGSVFMEPDPGLVQNTPWVLGDDAIITLDLSALPLSDGSTLNLIPQLNARQFLDVNAGDETGVDYMTLVIDRTIGISIDIKPGSASNSINLSSGGGTPVAILGSDNLDVNDINLSSLSLGTAGIKTVGKADKFLCRINDVSGDFSDGLEGSPDGFDDLICHFLTMEIVPETGETQVTLLGELTDGTPFEGTDLVNIVP